MLLLKNLRLLESHGDLRNIPDGKVLVNTVNAHSFNVAQKDAAFAEALTNGDYLIPDGASIVWACKFLKAKSRPVERCAGWDLFVAEMDKVNLGAKKGEKKPVVMFMGASERVLSKIVEEAAKNYPNVDVVTYSPPYRDEFNEEETNEMINRINDANPDLLWIGMTAPKQEKWIYKNWDRLDIHCNVGTIGAVFGFFAGTTRRAPIWMQTHGFEWLHRLLSEPVHTYRRYVFGNPLFLYNIMKQRFLK